MRSGWTHEHDAVVADPGHQDGAVECALARFMSSSAKEEGEGEGEGEEGAVFDDDSPASKADARRMRPDGDAKLVGMPASRSTQNGTARGSASTAESASHSTTMRQDCRADGGGGCCHGGEAGIAAGAMVG